MFDVVYVQSNNPKIGEGFNQCLSKCVVWFFSQDELVSAALEHCHRERIAVPDAGVDAIELTDGINPSLTVHFRVASPLEQDRVEISGRSLISAIDGFCERHGIPLPRGNQKELGCANGELALFYQVHRGPRVSSPAIA